MKPVFEKNNNNWHPSVICKKMYQKFCALFNEIGFDFQNYFSYPGTTCFVT